MEEEAVVEIRGEVVGEFAMLIRRDHAIGEARADSPIINFILFYVIEFVRYVGMQHLFVLMVSSLDDFYVVI